MELVEMEFIQGIQQGADIWFTWNCGGFTGIPDEYYFPDLVFQGNMEIIPIKGVG